MTNELLPVEWNGRAIRRREDGYFSATDMCQATGKLFNDWYRLDSTRGFSTALAEATGIPVAQLIQVVNGVGSWVHPDVATALAMWCSPEFHVFVVGLVRQWAEGKLQTVPVEESRAQLISRALIEACKEIDEKNKLIEDLTPSANAFHLIAASEGSQNLTETAKILRMPRNILIKKLHQEHWIYRRPGGRGDWTGYDSHTKNGDLEHVFEEIKTNNLRIQICQVRVTAQGISKLAKMFSNP